MLERLSIINERYNFLTEELTKPEVYNDFKKMKELNNNDVEAAMRTIEATDRNIRIKVQ